jgi:Domain of unknown function (DUF6456)
MNGRKEKAPGARSATATDVARSYARHAHRLLEKLAEPGAHAERREDQVVLLRKGGKLALSAGVPTGVLADLLESGAIICQMKAGRSAFLITEEGRARLRRAAASEMAGSQTPFADQHRTLVTRPDEDGSPLKVNLREDPLEFFRRAKTPFFLIGEAELAAGDRLRSDLTSAQSLPQVTANWSRLVVDGAGYNAGLTLSERVVAARARVDAALRAVGPDFSGLLIDVCGFSKGLEAIEREHALPLRSGKVALGYALRALARHYGLANAAVGKARAPMRHWGAEGYRPRLASGG